MPTLCANTWVDQILSSRACRTGPFITAALASAVCLLVSTLASGDSTEERWYRVELLIFAHEETPTTEQWPAIPELKYPTIARFLVDSERAQSNREGFEGSSEIDSYGRQFLRLVDNEQVNNQFDEQTIKQEENASDELPKPPPAVVTPTPFITLPANSREFDGKAAFMQRSGQYTTLFHEAWVQPIKPAREALPIIVDRSGDTRQWPPLQGSIKLHLSRYLHLKTNLWLNTSGEYFATEWRMPAPPLGPASLIIEEREPEILAEAATLDAPGPTLSPDSADRLSPNANAAETEGDLNSELIYPWRHAVLLDQSRRMRSGEVHYIDHPLLGVVIKLTPLDAKDLAELASAEALADQANQFESLKHERR